MIAPFRKKASVQSNSRSPENPTSRLSPGRYVQLASLLIANQVKRCDIIACCTTIIQMLNILVRSSTNLKPMLGYKSSNTHLDRIHVHRVSLNILKEPLNYTRFYFLTLALTSTPNLNDLFWNQCQFSYQFHYPPTLFMPLLPPSSCYI